MTIDERIETTQADINSIESKLQQLAQMQDQLIAEHNKNIGKLEAYRELLKESTNTDTSEEDASEKDTDHQGE